jgi:CHAT domain-containing protein
MMLSALVAAGSAPAACGGEDRQAASPTASVARNVRDTTSNAALAPLLRRADSIFLLSTDSAQALWRSIARTADSLGDSASIARATTGLGQVARLKLELDDARRLGESALALKLRLGMRSDLFRSYNTLGLLAWDEGRLPDALELYSRASAAAESTGDAAGLAKSRINIGLVRIDLGEFDAARDAYVSGGNGARDMHDSTTMGRAWTNLAALDIKLGDPLSALASLESARLVFAAVEDSLGIANALGQAATAYDALGEPQRAFAALDSALRIARSQSFRKEEAEDLKVLADLYAAAGDHQRALDHYRNAAQVATALGDPEERGNLLRNQARSYFALGRADLSARMAREALRLHSEGQFRVAQLGDLVLLAELAHEAGRPNEAESQLRSAHALAVQLHAGVELARVAIAEARIADRSGDARRVVRALDVARAEIATSSQATVAEAAALRLHAYARLGQLDAAAAAGRQAAAAIERVRGNYGGGQLRTSFASDRAGVYADLVMVLLRLGRTAEAFEVADAARGRALLDHVASARNEIRASGSAGREPLDADQLLRRIDELMARLHELEQKTPRERVAMYVATTRDLAERVAEARTQYEALITREPLQSESIVLLGGVHRSAAIVQAALDSGEVLLEYFVTPARLYIFVMTHGSLRCLTSDIAQDDLSQRARLARDLMARSRSDGHELPVLRALHESLMRPVIAAGAFRGARRLIIVRHSALTYLPFAALLNPSSQRYLVEDLPVLYVPSAAAMAALRARGQAKERRGRVAPIAFAPFPRRLPGTQREVESFVRTLPSARAILGAEATEPRLRDALRSGAAVHVATHAVMNARNPLFSRIELAASGHDESADNGRLEVHELLALRVASPLVFLSGCETGVGDAWSNAFELGEDYTTLAQSFLFAGADNVVATLWRINDESAAALAARFYEWSKTLPFPEALARAQREMLAAPTLSAPYFWAAYEVTGGPRFDRVLQIGP